VSPISERDVEQEVLEWFREAWDPELSLVEWRDRLVESGWAVPSWSSEWFGRDLPAWADRVAHRTIRRSGGVAVPLGGGMGLAAPTIYDHGSDELKAKYLRPTITGELTWCQLFSEPGAGSDLAGLRATAVRDGDEWVVNGQKVWNTMAHQADMAILVARTDWDVPKHAGITYFLIDMRQPGVEVRQIVEMNYHDSFNEVFLNDARIPASDVVGAVGDGWKVARGTLAHERSFSAIRDVYVATAAAGRVIDEARAEAAEYNKTYEWYPQRRGRVDLVIERAEEMGVVGHPVVRQEMMKLISFERASGWTAERAKATRALGRPPGSEGSIGKLALSEIARQANHVHSMIAGARGLLRKGDDPLDAVIAEILVSTPAQSIAGGTDEIQHNILGEHVLGLPREPVPDRDVPFREVGTR
jgi:alkylation response protein AidB-like acyl-CoA dehydrogenase